MGMWINIDYMIVPKIDFDRWENGELYLDLYGFKFMEKEKFDEEFDDKIIWIRATYD